MSIGPTYSQLGTRFWLTKDVESLEKVSKNMERVVPSSKVVNVQEMKITDRRILTLAQSGVSEKLEKALGRAKVFAKKIDEAALPFNSQLAEELGGIEGMAHVVGRILHENEKRQKERPNDTVAEIERAARKMLKVMLATADFQDIRSQGLTEKSKSEIRLSLINATLGALKLVREGKATAESVFELAKGKLYDLAKATDIYKLSVQAALRAREKFIDAEGVETQVNALIAQKGLRGTQAAAEANALVEKIIEKRRELSVLLDVTYDVGDGKTATVEKKLKEVRERMRAFRYDIEQRNGTNMGRMERLRRWFDDVGSSKENRTGLDVKFNEEKLLVAKLNEKLGIGQRDNSRLSSCLIAGSTQRATSLTHTANNQIRYYFSGKERQLDVFNQKAHEIFDAMQPGDTRTVKFSAGVFAEAGVGVAEISGDVMYAHTVTVSRTGDEYVITRIDGVEVSGQASFGLGYQDGEEASAGSPGVGKTVVGGSVGGGISGHVGRKASTSFKSSADLIASLHGEGSIVTSSPESSRLCLGRIWMKARKLGHSLLNLATKFGFREHHSRMDQKRYQAQLVSEGILGELDHLVSLNGRGIKTMESSGVRFGAGYNFSASLSVGRYDGANSDGETSSSELFGAGFSVNGSHSRDAGVKSVAYRPLTEKLANHSVEWLMDLVVNYERPRDVDAAFDRLRAIERQRQKLESATEAQRRNDEDALSEGQIADFARKLTKLAAEVELLKRDANALLDANNVAEDDEKRKELDAMSRQLVFDLDRPNVTMTDNQFRKHFLEKLYAGHEGLVTHTIETTFHFGLLEGRSNFVDEKLGLDNTDGSLMQGIGSTFLNEPHVAVVNAALPLDQTIQIKVTSSHRTNQDDVRPWRNVKSTDVEVAFSANLGTRQLAAKIGDFLFKNKVDNFTEDRPEVLKDFIDDVSSGLKDAFKDAGEGSGNLALKLWLKKLGGESAESGYENDGVLKLKFSFENGRLVSIAEQDSSAAKGTLSVGVNIGPAKVGLKASEMVSTVSTHRRVVVTTSLTALLGQVAPFARGGSENLPSVKGFVTKNNRPVLQLMKLLKQRNDVARVEADHAQEPTLVEDFKEAKRLLDDALKFARALADRGSADMADRAKRLIQRLTGGLTRLADTDFDNPDKKQEQLDVAANLLTDLVSVYTLVRECGRVSA